MNPMGVLVVIHRYLGVIVGLLMTLWCLSGFVMMYQSYPELSVRERLAGLEPLRLNTCCATGGLLLADDTAIVDFRIEMLAGRPVLNLSPDKGVKQIVDLTTGAPVGPLSDADVLQVARAYGEGAHISGQPRLLPDVVRDQWTVQTARRNAPVRHLAFDDAKASEIYVSGLSGEVFQDTSRRERLLSWLGAVPHWLYPTILRENVNLWSQLVIWTSVAGVFLTFTGLYVGVVRWIGAPKGRASPFRGLWMWHHMIGLVFGVLTLTWVASGLLSMNPWGLLEDRENTAPDVFAGTMTLRDVKSFVGKAGAWGDGDIVQLRATPVGGRVYAVALDRFGDEVRMDGEARPRPLTEADVRAGLSKLPLSSVSRIETEDAYYYGHHQPVTLPVYRAVLKDRDVTRLYIDARSGLVLRSVGSAARQARWLQAGLHDFDLPVLRRRPLWDVAVLLFLTGASVLCATGVWLAIRRLGLDFRRLSRRRPVQRGRL